uniref:Uncharacterized protein n=1 Tax=Heterorhabditis bacteriophora TaxID=37862 RepID=A0A1I7W813_HETBA
MKRMRLRMKRSERKLLVVPTTVMMRKEGRKDRELMLFFLLLVYISHFLESETATLITEIIDSNEQTWLLFVAKYISDFGHLRPSRSST